MAGRPRTGSIKQPPIHEPNAPFASHRQRVERYALGVLLLVGNVRRPGPPQDDARLRTLPNDEPGADERRQTRLALRDVEGKRQRLRISKRRQALSLRHRDQDHDTSDNARWLSS